MFPNVVNSTRPWSSPGVFLLVLGFLGLLSTTRVRGIAGLEGTFEFGLDAPWRIEPAKRADGTLDYAAIPIQITIHGARHASLDNILYPLGPGFGGVTLPDNVVSLGKFHSVRITELTATGSAPIEFPLHALHEIEMTVGDWPFPRNEFGILPAHSICRLWDGKDPEPFRDLSASSEWHGTLFYTPQNPTPGTVVALQVEVRLQRDPWPTPIHGEVTVAGVKVGIDVPLDFSPLLTLRNVVRIYLAPDPLPRFDNRWLYGDFHYHSQGTDNEGEAGYNYRGVIRAMGAMGLDFLFATDHASSSGQIVDADLPRIDKIPEIAHAQGDRLSEDNVTSAGGFLRDMNADRFAFCHGLIYGPGGANNEASFRAANLRFPQNYKSYGVVPQIFLGGELDAVPEVRASTVQANTFGSNGRFTVSIPYGNGLTFHLNTLCSPFGCSDPRERLLDLAEDDSYLVRDFQSLDAFQFYGRGHLVYFPNSSNLMVGSETAFIPSHTSRFGGATRRLDSSWVPSANPTAPLLPEIERKGVVFIAHHLNAGSGGRGPDGVPWTTDHMLLKAFRSPAVLGLEFWNENNRNRTRICSHEFCRDSRGYAGRELGYERHETLEADSNNPIEDLVIGLVKLLGGDLLPAEFHQIALPLEEVRRGFISGGASGGQFELYPFDPLTGQWQESLDDIEHVLAHGAYDWDVMNLRGMDFENNQDLAWLPRGEPRRMFMGGGSDAHGDLNYRRAGYFLGADDANDTAIGKPRNLVFVGPPEGPVIYSQGIVVDDPAGPTGGSVSPAPGSATTYVLAGRRPPFTDLPDLPDLPDLEPQPPPSRPPIDDIINDLGGFKIRGHTQEQIVRALRGGQFCVTDGPIIRMVIDRNGNNQIDDDDVQMGSVYRLPESSPGTGDSLTLLTQVISTPEFGPVVDVDVYVGVHPSPNRPHPAEPVEPRVYAPLSHGPGGFRDDAVANPQILYESNGRLYLRQKDRYWQGEFLGDNLTWNAVSGDALRYTHTLVTTLHLDKYEVGKGISARRFFVRAFAGTASGSAPDHVSRRYAYSNPIWICRQESLLPPLVDDGHSPPDAPVDPALSVPTIHAALNAAGEVVIHFTGTCTFSPRLGEPFQDIPGAASPYVVPPDLRSGFFRARR